MTVLGIETATLVCGAAVAADGRVLADRWVEARNVHAEQLMRLVDEALGGIGLAALDALAVSAGPGSFTGLRVGVSVAKGLALASGKPVVAVPTLVAIAERAARESAGAELIVPLLDARQGEVYYQLFRSEGRAVPVGEPGVGRVEEVRALCAGRDVLFTGEAAAKGVTATWGRLAEGGVARCSAGMVALLGEAMAAAGQTVEAALLEPRYIKEFFLKAPQS